MSDSIKVVDFKDKYQLLTKMPVYIKNNNTIWIIRYITIICTFIVFGFVFVDLDKASSKFVVNISVFFALSLAFLFFILFYSLKSGNFVMAADESGIYYRIFDRKDEFILIEWRIIDKIVATHLRRVARLDVYTVIDNEIPKPSNAGIINSFKTDKIMVSFAMPPSINSSKIKLKLDELRVKSL